MVSLCPDQRHRSACLVRSFRSIQHRRLMTFVRFSTLKPKLPSPFEKHCLDPSTLSGFIIEVRNIEREPCKVVWRYL